MSDNDKDIPVLLNELDRLATGTSERLTAAVEDVDKIIELLTQARSQIAQGLPPLRFFYLRFVHFEHLD